MDNPSSDGHLSGEVLPGDPPAPETPRAEPGKSRIPPFETASPSTSGILVHALAGLQAGVVGVIWMFVCLFVAAFWGGGGIWSVPNLFSTLFYGDNAWQNEFFRTTWAGIALIVVLYSGIGIGWGCFWKGRRRSLLAFSGALFGLATYFFFFNFVWLHVDPLISLYAPTRQLQVAHILWGVALAKSPGYSIRIAAALQPKSGSGGDTAASGQETAEIVRGELIR